MRAPAEPKGYYTLGRLLKAHGIKGEFKAYFDVQHLEDYLGLDVVFVSQPGKRPPEQYTVTGVRHDKGQFVILALAEVTTRDAAEALAKRELYLPEDLLEALDETSFYYHEVTGLPVMDDQLGEIGTVKEVREHPGQDLLRVNHTSGKEILIPITDAFIPRIDREAGTLHTNLPDGLLEVYLEA